MSMWEPRSSHLYVCTGLRVCEWLCVCVCRDAVSSFSPHSGQSGTGCGCQCVSWRVRVFCAHGLWTLSSEPFNVCLSQCVSLRYVTLCVVHSSVWPVSGHALVWVIRVGGCALHVGSCVQPRVGLSEDACGHM